MRWPALDQDGGVSLLYTTAIYNIYRVGTLFIRMEASHLLYTAATHNKYNSTWQRKFFSSMGVYLLYTVAIYNS